MIEPAYKHYSNGDNVAAGNKVSLVPYSATNPSSSSHTKHQLHLSQSTLPDRKTAAEVPLVILPFTFSILGELSE